MIKKERVESEVRVISERSRGDISLGTNLDEAKSPI